MAVTSQPNAPPIRAPGVDGTSPQLDRLASLNALTQALGATQEETVIYERALDAVRDLFPDACGAAIHRLDAIGRRLEVAAQWGDGGGSVGRRRNFVAAAEHPISQAVRSGEAQWGSWAGAEPGPDLDGAACCLVVPLSHRTEALGTLAVVWPGDVAPDPQREAWLRGIAHPVALALGSARAVAEQTRARDALFRLSSHISLSHEEAAITAAALDYCIDLTGAEYGFLALPEPSGEIRVAAVRGLAPKAEAAARERLDRPEFRSLYESAIREGAAIWAAPPIPLMAVPLLCGDQSVGAMALVGKDAGFDENDRQLLVMFANQAAVAVQNAGMVREIATSLDTRRRQLDSLSRASQELSAARDESTALRRVVKSINEAFDAHSTWVMLCDERMETYSTRMFWNRGSVRFLQMAQAWDRGRVGAALADRRPVFIPDIQAEAEFPFHDEVVTAGLRALLAVPLIAHGRPLGILAIFTDAYTEANPPDWDFVLAFASQAAVAIQNARWHADESERVRREALVNRITAAVRESIDVTEVMQSAVLHLGEALGAHRSIALLGQEGGDYQEYLHCVADCPVDTSGVLWETCPVVRQVEETHAPVALDRCALDPTFAEGVARFTPPPHSILAVPARRQGRLVGIFLFHQCDRPRRWRPAEVELAQRVADQVAIAVENALLYRRSVENETFRATLLSTAAAVTSSRAPDEVLRIVCRQGMQLLNADGAYVWQLDEDTDDLVAIAAVGHKAERFSRLRLSLSRRRSVEVQAVVQRSSIVAHDAGLDPQVNARLSRLFDSQSLVAVPLIARDRVLGVVVFSITQPGRGFSEAAIRRTEILLSHVATAVENAQLNEETRRRAEELEILWSIGQEVVANLEPERVLERIAQGARRLLAADAAAVMHFDERRTEVTVAAADGLGPEAMAATLPADRPLLRSLKPNPAPQATSNLGADPVGKLLRGSDPLQSMLSVPLLEESVTAGALNVYARGRRAFSISDSKALSTLASFASIALKNARAYQREYHIARRFQDSLLPELSVRLEGVEIAHRYLAALRREADVGGDLYDVISLPDGCLGVVIGDIAGKGLNAAVYMQTVRSTLRAFALESSDPADVMARLNFSLSQIAHPEWFVTLFYGVLDRERGEIVYANAGHESPILLRADGEEPELLATTGPILGLDPDACYREARVSIGPADTLVLYTDGFTEARRDDEFLQVEGLQYALREMNGAAPDQLVAGLCRTVTDYTRGELHDDATVVVIRATGPGQAGLSRNGYSDTSAAEAPGASTASSAASPRAAAEIEVATTT